MRCLWLPDVLRAAGLRVVETDGWRDRGKDLQSVEGVCAHHTASPATSTLATNLHVVTNGNAVAPGPIAQILLWRDGTCYIIASGRANHAGAGGPLSWLPASVPGVTSPANMRTIGIEAVNDGVGEPWAPEMLDAYEIMTAAILAHIGQNASRTFTHSEWAPTRKIDPAGPTGGRIATLPGRLTWQAAAWRERVSTRLEQPAPPKPDPEDPPAPPVPLPPQENHLMYTVIQVIDDDEAFGGLQDINGIIPQITWLSPSRYSAVVAKGAPIIKLAAVDLKNCDLLGPLPTGWKSTDFANVIGG